MQNQNWTHFSIVFYDLIVLTDWSRIEQNMPCNLLYFCNAFYYSMNMFQATRIQNTLYSIWEISFAKISWSWSRTLSALILANFNENSLQRYIMIHGIYLHISATWKVRYVAWTKLYTSLLMLMFFCWCFFVVADTDVFCWCWCMYLCWCWCWAHLCW